MKALKEKIKEDNPERLAAFEAAATHAVKNTIFAKFDDWQFFMGESCNPSGMHCLMGYREDQVTPYMLFFKDGLIEEKVVCWLLVIELHVTI